MLNIKRVLVIALILLLVGVIGGALTLQLPAENEVQSEELEISDEEFDHINILTDNTAVNVLPTNESTASVEFEGSYTTILRNRTNEENFSIDAEIEADMLSISAKEQRSTFVNFDFLFSRSSSLTVYLPVELYDSIQIETSNGRIQVGEMQAEDINLDTTNGQIRAENVEASSITTHTSNGSIFLEDVEGDLSASTSNGGISLITDHLDRPIDFETSNGHIDIQTENEPTNATIDVDTDNGEARIFGNANENTVVGNGDNLIKLRTNNGRVTVE